MATYHYKVNDQNHLLRRHPGGSDSPAGRINVDLRRLTWVGPLRPIAHDLIRIACAVHQVDRTSPRDVTNSATLLTGWHRKLALEVCVENPSTWQSHVNELEGLLKWLTDDTWTLEFRMAQTLPPRQQDWRLERIEGAEEVALFSGGLDSMAGALARYREQKRPIYFLSSIGNTVRENFLSNALAALRNVGLTYHRWIPFHHQLRQRLPVGHLDTTQRTRGFLFWCLGAAMADTLQIRTLTTYECGTGAINLPQNSSQTGAFNTRSMHPWTLLRLESLFQQVLGTSLRLDSPFLLTTKGELCRQVGGELHSLASASNSCDETERSKSNVNEHCGVCTSCLLRRTALHTALGMQDPTPYRSRETRRCGQYEVRVFHEQAQDFLKLDSYEALANYSLSQMGTVVDYLVSRKYFNPTRHEAQQQLLSLFHRYAAEVLSFYEQHPPRSLPKIPRRRTTSERPYAPLLGTNW